MNSEQAKSAARPRKPRKRKFFMMDSATASRASGFELLNEAVIFKDGPPFFDPPPGKRGFRDYAERPVFMANPKRGRIHWDLEWAAGYRWFVTEPLKAVLQAVDPDAFAFLECEMRSPDGGPTPARWLCDIVRVLDALDEDQSETQNGVADDGRKTYRYVRVSKLVFREDVVANSHIFRMKYADYVVICDEELKSACKAAGLKGLSFQPTE